MITSSREAWSDQIKARKLYFAWKRQAVPLCYFQFLFFAIQSVSQVGNRAVTSMFLNQKECTLDLNITSISIQSVKAFCFWYSQYWQAYKVLFSWCKSGAFFFIQRAKHFRFVLSRILAEGSRLDVRSLKTPQKHCKVPGKSVIYLCYEVLGLQNSDFLELRKFLAAIYSYMAYIIDDHCKKLLFFRLRISTASWSARNSRRNFLIWL